MVRLVQDLQGIPKNELAAFIRTISYWKCPRSELHVWFGVLDRFDEIMENLISQYDAANLQLTPFSEQDKELLFQILRFERMLLDNSTNRKLFNSYDVSDTLAPPIKYTLLKPTLENSVLVFLSCLQTWTLPSRL